MPKRGSLRIAGGFARGLRLVSAAAALAAACAFSPAQAATEAGAPGSTSQLPLADLGVTTGEIALLKDAFEAIRRNDARRADALRTQIAHPVARKLIDWRLFIDRQLDQEFERIGAFSKKNPDWPRADTIRRKAENAIPDGASAAQVIAWFGESEPVTGKGHIRLAEALMAQGQVQEGRALIRKAWTSAELDSGLRAHVLSAHGRLLDKDAHAARVDWLLWNGKTSEARSLFSRIDPDLRLVAQARIAMRAGARDAAALLSAVPAQHRANSGLLYDRVRWLRRRSKDEETWPLIAGAPRTAEELVNPESWWRERHLQARKALKDKDPQAAYAMVSGHGLERGAAFADAEWLAGWIALRFLDKPEPALAHFTILEERVSTPISKGRAFYWIGRAAEALGDTAGARRAYRSAADRATTFYGQLAAERLGAPAFLVLPSDAPVAPLTREQFRQSELAQALRLIAAAKSDADMRRFVYGIDDALTTAEEHVLYADLLGALGYPHLSVRIGKYGVGKHLPIVERAYPVPELEGLVAPGKQPEPALVLGLSRQESEFNPRAVSRAGARGLMQLMPATARITARRHGLKYAKSWLLDRPSYNAELGRAHLRDLLADLDGSYILTIASYNAGKRRAEEWIEDYGDPRTDAIDPIDWIELIPFSETRNYVQRVMENTLVYRNRISGRLLPITLSADLRRSARVKGPDYERMAAAAPAIGTIAPPEPQLDTPSIADKDLPLAELPASAIPRPKPLPRSARRADAAASDLAFARNLPFVDGAPRHFQRPAPTTREAKRKERRAGGYKAPEPEAAEPRGAGGRVNGPVAVGDMLSLFAPVGELVGRLGSREKDAPKTTARVAEIDPSVKPSLVIALDPPKLQKPAQAGGPDAPPPGTEAAPVAAGDADLGLPEGEAVAEDGGRLKVWQIPEGCDRFVVSLEGSGRCASDLEAELASGAGADEPI